MMHVRQFVRQQVSQLVSLSRSISQSVSLSQSADQSISQSVCQSVSQSNNQSVIKDRINKNCRIQIFNGWHPVSLTITLSSVSQQVDQSCNLT